MSVDAGDSTNEDRSLRLLQPKLRILYYIWKRSGVRDNISQISRDLGYQKDSWINESIHSLIDDKFLDVQERKDGNYFVLTGKGRRKIAPVALSWLMPLMIIVVALMPWSWAMDEMVYKIAVQPWIFVVGTIAIMGIGVFLFYEVRMLEKEYFGA